MAERPINPKDVRVSMVDRGWSESPPDVKEAPPPPPPLPNKAPPPPPLPGSAAAQPEKKSDEITRDETPDISDIDEVEPSTEAVPRELPMYEDAARDHLVTRVDDQMQARANAMAQELDEPLSDKTLVGGSPVAGPVSAPRPADFVEPFPPSRSSPKAADPPPPPPLPGARAAPNVSSSPKAASSPQAASSPKAAAVPPLLPQQLVTSVAAVKTEATAFPPKVRTAAWPIPQPAPPAQPALPATAQPTVPAFPVVGASPAEPPKPAAPPFVAPVAPVAQSASSFPATPSTFPNAPSSVTMVDKYGPVSTLRDALVGRVRIANRPVPLWGVLAVVLVVTTILAALFVGVLGGSSSPSAGAAPAASASGEVAGPEAAPTAATADQGKPKTLLERAASGDATALATLQQKKPKDLGTDEALAIARGKVAGDVIGVKKLRERLAADPGAAKDKKLVADLLRFAHGRETSDDALASMAALPGPLSADLVYEVWTGTAERSDATELARSILLGKDVRPKASPALSIAIDLREVTTCEDAQSLLGRAIEHGDKRSLVPINKLARKTGCGPNKRLDCYPCLREGDLVKRAFNAVRVRREPDLLR